MPTPPLTMNQTAALALGSLTLAGALAFATPALAPDSADPLASYSAVIEYESGESETVESGLTYSQCEQALDHWEHNTGVPVTWCEREPGDSWLVGYDCEGASAPLYARTESDFPQCRAIERAPVPHNFGVD